MMMKQPIAMIYLSFTVNAFAGKIEVITRERTLSPVPGAGFVYTREKIISPIAVPDQFESFLAVTCVAKNSGKNISFRASGVTYLRCAKWSFK